MYSFLTPLRFALEPIVVSVTTLEICQTSLMVSLNSSLQSCRSVNAPSFIWFSVCSYGKNRPLQLLNHLNSLSDVMRKCAEISDQYAHVLHGLGPATLQVIQPMPPMGSPFAAGPPMGAAPQLNVKQMMPPPQLPVVPVQPNGVGKRKADHGQEGEVTKRKRVKRPRDPDAPKRPPSSYLLFQNEVRQAMKRANPAMANHEILTNISQRWAGMSPEEKEVRP